MVNTENKTIRYFKGDELATSVWINKYKYANEESPDDMHKRMAKAFYEKEKKRIAKENKKHELISDYGKKREDLSLNKIYNYFKDFKYIVPQGSIMAGLGTNLPVSLSNCWVVPSPYDSYTGIMKADSELAFYYKRRGGVGIDISTLRPKGAKTQNSAKTTTGAVSFMHRFSNTTREVAMNGRRGALMITIDVNHPDVLDFIKIKRDKTSVTGANISVRVNNKFMQQVENDGDYYLRFPVNSELPIDINETVKEYNKNYYIDDTIIVKKIKAKEYWKEMMESATKYAEPGILYWDNFLDYDPAAVYEEYKPISTNPCGEQGLNAYDSCRLMALNLYSFVDNPFSANANVNYSKLYEVAYEQMRLGDTLVDLELDYMNKIINKIKSDPEPDEVKFFELNLWQKSYENAEKGRRVGLGITGLGDMLAALGIQYGSKESFEVVKKVMKTKMKAELDATIDMSALFGSFENWDFSKEYDIEDEGDKLNFYGNNKFYSMLREEFKDQMKRMRYLGRRNVSWSTIAPTGSVSILTQTTSGVEPLFAPYYMRRKKIMDNSTDVDFIDDNGDKWQEYPVFHPKFKEWLLQKYGNLDFKKLNKDDIDKMFAKSPYYKSTAGDIEWKKRVDMQAILQKYTTNAISSTINLPRGTEVEKVEGIYRYGWKKGLKGQTVYVDGSRDGVLVTETKKTNNSFEYTDSPKRPTILPAEAHTIQIAGTKYAVFIGFMNNLPYEVFVYEGTTKQGKGSIEKKESGNYVFIGEGENSKERILTEKMDTTQRISTRLVSGNLRHGRHFKYLIEDIQKEGAGIFDWFTAIKKALAKYLKNEDLKDSNICPSCETNNLVYKEGCKTCKNCGWSACG